MALTFAAVLVEADAMADHANDLALWLSQARQIKRHNSDMGIDWTAGSTPSYITEDAAGNISGRTVTRGQIGNYQNLLDQIIKLIDNQVPTQADYVPVINLLAKPLG